MENSIEKAIEKRSRKILKRQRKDVAKKEKDHENYLKRTGKKPIVNPLELPKIWGIHNQFDPRFCIKNSQFLARTIWKKLQEGSYKPIPALMGEIPKPNGEIRAVMSFSIPDAAISNLFHDRLTERNINIFSSNNYSYRPDRNIFDAIINMKSALEGENTFIVQYDFRKYFDSISHSYIKDIINEKGLFLITNIERNLINSFLIHKFANPADYKTGNFTSRDLGVPQGTSISLFLANIANHALDKALEKHGGQFVRFADDVVAITYKYEDALGVSEIFSKHCKESGVKINRLKSPGISIFSESTKREIRTKCDFNYLGHKFTKHDILLSDSSINRIKRKISEIIYIHLIQTPRDRNLFNKNRVGAQFYDWDLVRCINEIRGYIYGGLTHFQLEKFIEKNKRLPQMRGLMSFYPLVTNLTQLKTLDGWLISTLNLSIKERCKTLKNFNISQNPLSKSEIIDGSWHTSPDPTIFNDTRCPSFVYGWRAAKKFYVRFGLKDITPPSYYSDHSLY